MTSATQRGGALLAVLWLAAALSAIAFSIANTVRTETERAGTASEGLRAYYLAAGSVERAALWIEWGVNGAVNPDGSPKYFRLPMPYLRFNYPSGVVIVEVIPEESKININMATPPELMTLLTACGANPMEAEQITAAILDWRTGSPPPPSMGFMNPDQTFVPRHASFEEIEEVLLVRGMSPDLFYGRFGHDPQGRLVSMGGLRDAITVYGNQANQADANSASAAELAAIGLPPQVIDAIIQRRLVRPFKGMDELAPLIAGLPAAGRLQVASGPHAFWTIRATARIRNADGRLSDLARTVSSTIAFSKQLSQQEPPYHVIRWRDEAAPVASSALPF